VFDSVALAEYPDDPGPDGADWVVEMAANLGPGGEALNLLGGAHLPALSDSARVSALAQLTAIIAHAEAVRASYTAGVAGPRPEDPREDWGSFEVAAASRCSVYAADAQVAFARDLAGRLSATAEAMRLGRVTYLQARALSEGVSHLGDDIAQEIEERLLRYAYRQDLSLFRASLKRWLAKLDPTFTAKAEAARAEVTVEHTAYDNGVGELFVRGPLELTSTLDTALTAYATASKPSLGCSSAARKLTGLVQWAEDYLTSPNAPRRHGRATTINICIDAATVFGLASHPAEIPGYGFIPASAAIALLADGAPIRRLLIDPADGHLLHYGRTTYTVPPALAAHLIALHQRSATPNSAVAAAGCDLDHNTPFENGGTTDPDNTTPLDRRWHRAKTHAGWSYVKHKDGTVTWTSPNGLKVRVDPHDYRLGP
jgi:hypothetical protein